MKASHFVAAEMGQPAPPLPHTASSPPTTENLFTLMEVPSPKGKYSSKKVAGASPPRTYMVLPSHNFNSKSFYLPFFFFFVLNHKHLGFMLCMGSSFPDGSEFSHAMFVWFKLLPAEQQRMGRESHTEWLCSPQTLGVPPPPAGAGAAHAALIASAAWNLAPHLWHPRPTVAAQRWDLEQGIIFFAMAYLDVF